MGQIGLTKVTCTRANRDTQSRPFPEELCDGCAGCSLAVLPPHCEDTMDRRQGRRGGGRPLLSSSFRCSQGGRGRSVGGEGGAHAENPPGSHGMPPSSPAHTQRHLLFHLSAPPSLRGPEDQSVRDDRNKQQTDRRADTRGSLLH